MHTLDPAYVWGIDVAAQRLAFAFIHRDGTYQVNHVAIPEDLRGAQRLSAMYASATQFANLMGGHFPPLECGHGPGPTHAIELSSSVRRRRLGGLTHVPGSTRRPVEVVRVALDRVHEDFGVHAGGQDEAVTRL